MTAFCVHPERISRAPLRVIEESSMTHGKSIDSGLRFIAADLRRPLFPSAVEHTLNLRIGLESDYSRFRWLYRNATSGPR